MEPHDYLDCMSMCYAVAASQGISGSEAINRATASKSNMPIVKRRPKIKLV